MLLSKMEGSEEDTPITNVANARPSLTFQEQLIMAEKSHQFLLLGCAGFTPIKSVAMENTFFSTQKFHCCKASPGPVPLVISGVCIDPRDHSSMTTWFLPMEIQSDSFPARIPVLGSPSSLSP